MRERITNLEVGGKIVLFKNAKVLIESSNGSFVTVSLDELRRLDAGSDHETLTAARTLTAADNRKTFYLSALAGFTVTLPSPALGLEFEFVVSLAPTSNGYSIVSAGLADIIKGLAQESETDTTEDGPTDQNADTLLLAANIAVAGDYLRLRSDGTSWFFEGQTAADGGLAPSNT